MDGPLRSPLDDDDGDDAGDGSPKGPESGGVAVAGSFTLDLFRERLVEHPFCETFRDRVTCAPYGQLTPFLLTAPSARTVVLLVRWEDWFRHAGEAARGDLSPRSVVREFAERLESFCARHASRVLLVVCPSPADSRAAGGDPETALAEEELARRIARLPAVTVAWAEGWAGHPDDGEVHDPYLDRLAHLPYTEAFFGLLADRVAGLLAEQMPGPPADRGAGRPTAGNRPAPPPSAADGPGAGWTGTEWKKTARTAPPPDRTFRRLVDAAGDLRAENGGTGIVPLAWRPWLPADAADGPGWGRAARALDALLADLVLAVREFRRHSGRPLLITVPPRERVPSPLTNLFGHAEDSVCAMTAELTDMTVVWAAPADSAGAVPGEDEERVPEWN
ncbi:hypothetical protein GTZ89_43650 [Streptomyces sp. SID8382]|uniref:hypothetical protein n=2 Tax=Streptomyces TaxID=1883 RepID=UPI000C2C50D3|nr:MULTISPECIES: hypothetical protein [unclassified Streptomyces]AUA16313.1 hypothetical protein CFP59_08503 [Streptomyces sp. M56]MYX62326.1 hypothetical protein [Streptomyces sp. SID8382]